MPLEESTGKTLYCVACGALNYSFASFCIECGEPLDPDDAAPSPFSLHAPGEPQAQAPDGAPAPASPESAAASRARSWARWETAAGLLILLLAVGYALYNWQRTNAETQAYHDGIGASQRHEWEQAVRRFEGAGGYRDAQARRAAAEQAIETRDRLYTGAVQAARQEDWETALGLFRQVQEIQPSYLDVDTRLAGAQQQVLNSGLASIAYLVDRGPSPGLYVRDARGRSYQVPGSDAHSTVHAVQPGGRTFVFDRASTEQDFLALTTTHRAMAGNMPSPGPNERLPVLAVLFDDRIDTHPLPALDSYGRGIFTNGGLWWYTDSTATTSPGSEVFYIPLPAADPRVAVQVSDLAHRKRVAALDPLRGRVVIAETDEADPSASTQLFLARADGTGQRFLRTVQGAAVPFAAMSPDGRWLLYRSEDRRDALTKQLWVLDLDAPCCGTEGQVEARVLETLPGFVESAGTRLNATFLPQAIGDQPRVLVSRTAGGDESLVVHEVGKAHVSLVWGGAPQEIEHTDISGMSRDGRLILSPRRSGGNNATLDIISTGAGGHLLTMSALPVTPDGSVQAQFSPGDSYVIASVLNFAGPSRARRQKIYTARLAAGDTMETPIPIANAALPDGSSLPTLAVPEAGGVLAYVNIRGELHAAMYDGTSDTIVGRNVHAVWSLAADQGLRWRR